MIIPQCAAEQGSKAANGSRGKESLCISTPTCLLFDVTLLIQYYQYAKCIVRTRLANMFVVDASIWSFSWQMQFAWLDLISCSSIVACSQQLVKHPYKRIYNFFASVGEETLLQVSRTAGPFWLWWNVLRALMQFWFCLAGRLATSGALKLPLRSRKQYMDLNRTIRTLETVTGTSWCPIVISLGHQWTMLYNFGYVSAE